MDVNSYDFMQNINRDIGCIRTMFDATMALYQVIGQFNGITVVNKNMVNEAVIQYSIIAESEEQIYRLLVDIANLRVTIYDNTYLVTSMPNESGVTIILQPIL